MQVFRVVNSETSISVSCFNIKDVRQYVEILNDQR